MSSLNPNSTYIPLTVTYSNPYIQKQLTLHPGPPGKLCFEPQRFAVQQCLRAQNELSFGAMGWGLLLGFAEASGCFDVSCLQHEIIAILSTASVLGLAYAISILYILLLQFVVFLCLPYGGAHVAGWLT